MGPLKHSGLALAFSLALSLNSILLFYFLRRKLKHIEARRILKSFIKTLISAVIMGITGWSLLRGELWQTTGDSLEKALYLTTTIIFCVVLYSAASFFLKNEEMKYIYEMFKTKIFKKGTV